MTIDIRFLKSFTVGDADWSDKLSLPELEQILLSVTVSSTPQCRRTMDHRHNVLHVVQRTDFNLRRNTTRIKQTNNP